jgi:hypothetical protein
VARLHIGKLLVDAIIHSSGQFDRCDTKIVRSVASNSARWTDSGDERNMGLRHS